MLTFPVKDEFYDVGVRIFDFHLSLPTNFYYSIRIFYIWFWCVVSSWILFACNLRVILIEKVTKLHTVCQELLIINEIICTIISI